MTIKAYDWPRIRDKQLLPRSYVNNPLESVWVSIDVNKASPTVSKLSCVATICKTYPFTIEARGYEV